MAKDSIIRARDLAIGYGDHVLMERMDFDVAPGDVFLILGGSGTGKSTLLRTLIGLQASLGGRFEIEGREAPDGPPPYGVLFQSGALFGSMTLGQNVALPLETWTDLDARTIQELVCAKLRIVGLDGYENHMPAELSGGMKKRAGIARAMALEPRGGLVEEEQARLE
ncbi:MAG: ATP-binding cassette domain-containing protein, partial [Planctomycetota bacterium]